MTPEQEKLREYVKRQRAKKYVEQPETIWMDPETLKGLLRLARPKVPVR